MKNLYAELKKRFDIDVALSDTGFRFVYGAIDQSDGDYRIGMASFKMGLRPDPVMYNRYQYDMLNRLKGYLGDHLRADHALAELFHATRMRAKLRSQPAVA